MLAGLTASPTTRAQVFDDFERPDAAAIGNGWIEKNPAAFALSSGAAAKLGVNTGYRDNIVYRPASEDLTDVEVSVEFRLNAPQPGYPQVLTRVQSGTVANPNWLDGYILYVNNISGTAILGRQSGAAFVTSLANLPITPALNTTDTYRLRLRTIGANPVQLDAYIERRDGGAWTIVSQANVLDNTVSQIVTPGTVGFGGYVESSYRFDNFSATNLGGVSNPVPVTTGIAPASASEGGAAFSLTVNGSDFIPGSIVRWNGSDRATTFVSATELQAAIFSSDIGTAGSATVTVFNPAPGGGASNPQTFTIDSAPVSNPVPDLALIAPDSATEGGSAFSLTAFGSNFVPGSIVRWNGVDRPTTFVSASELAADISSADIAVAGTASVSVFTPGPGGGTSGALAFTIDPAVVANPVPTATSLNPASATEGGPALQLTVSGSDFVPGSVVRWNGADRTTTYVSSVELQAAISAADIGIAGNASVTVFSPAPGGGTSAPLTFTIEPAVSGNPVPTITSLNPNAATEGDPGFALTVSGAGFTADSVVRWNGTDRATSFVSASQLVANIAAADVGTPGSATVTVFTPAPGGGTSNGQAFLIQAAAGQFFDPFDRANGADLGNGWIEKNPAAFSLTGGAATKQAVGQGYRENIVYRPAGEDALNVEASVEFRLSSQQPGYPQVFTRVQGATVATPNVIDGYILYVNNSNASAILGRQTGASFVTSLATISINPALNTTDTFRLRLRSTGTDPVQLDAYVERWSGTAWTALGQASLADAAASRITGAGSVGFGGYVESSYTFDNFTATSFGAGANPAPSLNGLSPSSAVEGGSAFLLTATGSDFVPGSVVRWNGSDRATTYVSPTQVQASISSSDIAATGTASVTVFTPAPGGGTSAAQTFTIEPSVIVNPVPVLSSINPTSATEGGSAFVLTASGSNFVPGSTVRWNGNDRATTYVSANTLQASITAADIAAAGSAGVTVFTPGPGGGTSATLTFAINSVPNNPSPVVTSISPTSINEGSPAFTLTVNGADFMPNSIVRWNGSDRATTYFSTGVLQASISAADIASAGTASVTVFTPGPGGGTSTAQTFVIDAVVPAGPSPAIASLSPESLQAGSASQVITIVGDNFAPQSTASWNGSARPTTYISGQVLEISLTDTDLLSPAVGAVTVVNPAELGGGSAPHPMIVLDNGATYFIDNFNTPDSSNLGNNWTEKAPQVFSITDNAVTSIWYDLTYRDNIAYRPAGEDRLDVEVSAEFVRQPAGQFTQLHARAQRNTIGAPNVLESYIFYVEDNIPTGAMAIAVNTPIASMGECIIDRIPLPEQFQIGERYRMRFLVTGTDPVRLEGNVDRFTGGQWQPLFSAVTFHDDNTVPPGYYCAPGYMPAPIRTAGTTGISKWVDQADDYDNFYWIDLSGIAGVPQIASISPDIAVAGGSAFTLQVSGSNFTNNSTVQWNGAARPTTFVSSTMLQADISATDIAVVGMASVTVSTPAPGGGTSNAVAFDVNNGGQTQNPLPGVTALTPSSIPAGQPDTQLTVSGNGFVPASVVQWNGQSRLTSYVSENMLMVTVPAADLAVPGTASVTANNPAPGGGTSAPVSVSITGPGDFSDDFARPDSNDPQNGWTEKNPQSFALIGERLQKNPVGQGYRDNVVFRPVAESRGDVETSVEFRLSNAVPGYPQLFARLQPATIATANVLDGYILYVNNGNVAILGRQSGAAFVVPLGYITLTESLNTQDTYRMRMSVSGSAVVSLTGWIERLTTGGFVSIGSVTTVDSSAQRIGIPGMSGIGGYVEGSYSYDNFRDTNLN